MAWDFSTEPEFQAELDWMRSLVHEEIWPLETLYLSVEQLDRAMAPLRERVKARRLWAAHLDPELGGQGFGQVKLGLMPEVLGTSLLAPLAFGNRAPDSGNSGSTTACAGSGSASGRSTCSASARSRASPTARCWRRSRPCRTGSRSRRRRCTRRGS